MFRLLGVRTAGVLLGAVALFAIVGFAASFAINGNPGQPGQQDISSGAALVDSCNGNVEVDINGAFDGGQYEVSNVAINANPGCGWVSVTLTHDGASLGSVGPVALDALGDASLDFSGQDIAVADVNDVHVLIDEFTGDLTLAP